MLTINLFLRPDSSNLDSKGKIVMKSGITSNKWEKKEENLNATAQLDKWSVVGQQFSLISQLCTFECEFSKVEH